MTRTAEMQKVADEAAAHFNGRDGFANAERKNSYSCDVCGVQIITIDREPGVTPAFLSCSHYATPLCRGTLSSGFYRVPPYMKATHEWYRPDDLQEVPAHVRDHVSRGGLLLRRIPGEQEVRHG